ncbi:MAG: leucine-rich repeat domain-containing protein [Clostridia bacterium]|nr:leucine-rich repeat domain-containing protein [Clostridia bacterium]
MEGLSSIKHELLKQKEIIEARSGVVSVANTNPSPAEITEGIKTIPSHDLSVSTATESDVKQGKTFYSGNAILRTGTAVHDQEAIDALFMAPFEEANYDGEIYYTFPSGTLKTRRYLFYGNHNSVTINFNDDIEYIEEYSFYKAKNFKYQNFNELKNLKQVCAYGFAMGSTEGINLSRLPNSITTISPYAFYYSMQDNLDIVFPENLTYLGQQAFMSQTRIFQNSVDFTNVNYATLPTYCFYNNAFNCDFIIPDNISIIATYFNYNGCFKNITINENVKTVSGYCFGANSNLPVSDFYLKTVTFENPIPPTIGPIIFARQNIENSFKIYVPDESVDEYKAVANLASYYADLIYPISEKE